MQSFFESCLTAYEEAVSDCGGGSVGYDQVSTPFIDEDDTPNVARMPERSESAVRCPEAEFEKKPAGDVRTFKLKAPDLAEPHAAGGHPGPGILQPIAARVILKVYYEARAARFDLLRSIGYLATRITKWDADCDRRLHRLMSYVHSTLSYRQAAWVGDSIENLSLHLYSDADMAGDAKTHRSTSGVYLAIEGPRTRFPIASISKRQTSVSHSTPEAEIVAGATALRMVGIPGQELWEALVKIDGRKAPSEAWEKGRA